MRLTLYNLPLICLYAFGYLITASKISLAQVTSDQTVNTQVNQNGNVAEITGGEARGENLFHSFQDFSLVNGDEAFFNNATDISNIISRVTGSSVSNIDGLIRANGNANLFLINSNGIIFGDNAALDIGGSFVASTANTISFADGTELSTTDSFSSPILTVSVPIGLDLSSQSGSIVVEGTGNNFSADEPIFSPITRLGNFNGLTVNPGQSLTLLGNGVTLQGGNIAASEGNIQLGSVRDGRVGLNFEDFSLNFQEIQDFNDVLLTLESSVDASGTTGGSIQVRGKDITIKDGSVVLVQNQGSSSADGISIQADNDIEISGTNQNGLVRSYVLSEGFAGNTGNMEIFAKKLKVDRGAAIAIRTFGTANAGQLTLDVTDSIQVSGFNQVIPTASSVISSANLGNSQGGNVDISTKNVLVDNGGGLGTITIGGQGDSGSLSINAENITISGVNPINTLPSSLFSNTVGEGQGGETVLKTSSLNILEGGQISSGSGSSGNAGDIFIEADRLNLISNADIRPMVGDVNTSRIIAIAAPPTPAQQAIVGTSTQVTGASGNITIDSGNINIERARITVSNQGQGAAGNVDIQTNSLTNLDGIISASGLSESGDLDLSGGDININTGFLTSDDGSIVAATNFVGLGGNVTINSDFVILDNNSLVSASSGLIANNDGNLTGNGGNVVINAETLFAINESFISADAAQGNGGNVNIAADSILGIDTSNEQTFNDSITASSELGIDGTIQISTPDINNLQKE
jgi:filamentous hemagglutinin family protein